MPTAKKKIAKKTERKGRTTRAFRASAFAANKGACSYCSAPVDPFTAFRCLGDADGKVRILCTDCGAIHGAALLSWSAFVTKIENLRVKAIAILERYPAK